MKNILISLFLLTILKTVYSGAIHSWDFNIEYSPEGNVENIYIPFSLQNSHPKNNLIRINFPFSLGNTDNLQAFITQFEDSSSPNQVDKIYKSDIIENQYIFQSSEDLKPNTWYTLQINFDTNNQQYIQSGYYQNQPLQMFTTSLTDMKSSNFIINDQNQALGIMNIQEIPGQNLYFSHNMNRVSGTYNTNFQQENELRITLQILKDFTKPCLFILKLYNGFEISKCEDSPQDFKCNVKDNLLFLSSNNRVLKKDDVIEFNPTAKNPDTIQELQYLISVYDQDAQQQKQGQILAKTRIQYISPSLKTGTQYFQNIQTGVESFYGDRIIPENMNHKTFLYESDYSSIEPVGPHHQVFQFFPDFPKNGFAYHYTSARLSYQPGTTGGADPYEAPHRCFTDTRENPQNLGQYLETQCASLDYRKPELESAQIARTLTCFQACYAGFNIRSPSPSPAPQYQNDFYDYIVDILSPGNQIQDCVDGTATANFCSPPTKVNHIYNNLKFYFQLSQTIPSVSSTISNRVVLRVQNDNLLEGTIQTNLPDYSPDKSVFCRYEQDKAKGMYNIVCLNVGNILQDVQYFIRVKVMFKTSHSFTVQQSNGFGQFSFYQQDPNTDFVYEQFKFESNNQGIQLTKDLFRISRGNMDEKTYNIWNQNSVFSTLPEGGTDINNYYRKIAQGDSQAIHAGSNHNSLIIKLNLDSLEYTCKGPCLKETEDRVQSMMSLYYNPDYLTGIQRQNVLETGRIRYNTGADPKYFALRINIYEFGDADNGHQNNEEQYNIVDLDNSRYIYRCGNNGKPGDIQQDKEDCIFKGYHQDGHGSFLLLKNVIEDGQAFQSSNYFSENSVDFIIGFKTGWIQNCTGLCPNPVNPEEDSMYVGDGVVLNAYTIQNLGSTNDFFNGVFESGFHNLKESNRGLNFPSFYRIKGQLNTDNQINKIGVIFDSTIDLSYIVDKAETDPYDKFSLKDDEEGQFKFRKSNKYTCLIVKENGGTETYEYNNCQILNGETYTGNSYRSASYLHGNGVIFDYTGENFEIIIPISTTNLNPTGVTFFRYYRNTDRMETLYLGDMQYDSLRTHIRTQLDQDDLNDVALQTPLTFTTPAANCGGTGTWTYQASETWTLAQREYQFSNDGGNFEALNSLDSSFTIVCKSIDLFQQIQTLKVDSQYSCYTFSYTYKQNKNYILACKLIPNNQTVLPDLAIPRHLLQDMDFQLRFSVVTNSDQYFKCEKNDISQTISLSTTGTLNDVPIQVERNAIDLYTLYSQQQPFSIKITFTSTDQDYSQEFKLIQDQMFSIKITASTADLDKITENCYVQNIECFGQINANNRDMTLYLTPQSTESITELQIEFYLIQDYPTEGTVQAQLSVFRDSTSQFIHMHESGQFPFFIVQNQTSTQPVERLSLDQIVFEDQEGVKGDTSSFTQIFTIDSESIQPFSKNDDLFVNMGWLSNGQNINDMQCKIYKPSSDDVQQQISQDFNQLLINKHNIHIKTDTDLSTARNGPYKLQCNSVYIAESDATDDSSDLQYIWSEAGNEVQISQTQDQPTVYTNNQVATISLKNKLFNSVGLESIYEFDIKLNEKLLIESQISVKFSEKFVDTLNKQQGFVDCYINDILTFCELKYQNQVYIPLFREFQAQESFTVKIGGVTQAPLDKDDKIRLYIHKKSGSALQKSYHILPEILKQNIPNQYYIDSVQVSSPEFRKPLKHEIILNMPTESLDIFTPIILDFGNKSPYSLSNKPTCSLVRTDESTPYNFVKKCEFLDTSKLAIYLNKQDENINLYKFSNYKITIENGPSPHCYNDQSSDISPDNFYRYKILIPEDQSLQQVKSIILPKNKNQQTQVKFPAQKTDLVWRSDDNQLNYANCLQIYEVSIGYLSTNIKITEKNQENLFKEEFVISLEEEDNDTFQINPKSWIIYSGFSQSIKVMFGAKSTAKMGTYFLKTKLRAIQKESSYVDNMPLLGLQVNEKLCSDVIVSPKVQINAPVKTTSSPIIVDFRNCFPVEEVTVIAQISQNDKGQQIFDLIERQQTLYNTGSKIKESEAFLAFTIQNLDETVANGEEFTLTLKLTGKNGKSYKSLDPITVIAQNTNRDTEPPSSVSSIVAATKKTEVDFTVKCTQQGQIYYSLQYQASHIPYTIQNIIENTNSGSKPQIELGNNNDIQKYAIMGHVTTHLETEQQIGNFLINKLKAGHTYKLDAYCVDIDNKASTVKQKENIKTDDNNSALFRLNVTFAENAQLNSLQKQYLACAMQRTIPCSPSRVRTDELTYCHSQILQSFEDSLVSIPTTPPEPTPEPATPGDSGGDGEGSRLRRRMLSSKLKSDPREQRSYTYIYILKDNFSEVDGIENLLATLTVQKLRAALPASFPAIQTLQTNKMDSTSTQDLMPSFQDKDFKLEDGQIHIKFRPNQRSFLLLGLKKIDQEKRQRNQNDVTFLDLYNSIHNEKLGNFQLNYAELLEYEEDDADERQIVITLDEKDELYQLYWAALEENPTPMARSSQIKQINVINVEYQTYNYDGSIILQFSLFTCILLFLLSVN